MKGLYVYGALCMTLSFVVGMQAGNHLLMAGALVSAATSALSEAASEVITALNAGYPYQRAKPSAIAFQNGLAVLSWAVTAATVVLALFTLIGAA
jgi:hypothetical protein